MNTHANELKNCLLKIIDEMALSSDIFNLSGKPAFCRKSKFNFSTLIQFILSFGSNSLGHEIGEFFEYRKGFPTVSAFVQQRKKLSYTALEHLFYRFNECTFKKPVLYKNYRLLAIDGSDFSLPYNSQEDNVMGDNHFYIHSFRSAQAQNVMKTVFYPAFFLYNSFCRELGILQITGR
ncbi:MAG: hypothetical protein ACLRTC_18260 [Coprococcus sp.]